jgi:hypothetical protein
MGLIQCTFFIKKTYIFLHLSASGKSLLLLLGKKINLTDIYSKIERNFVNQLDKIIARM